jgi:hypothetical protein
MVINLTMASSSAIPQNKVLYRGIWQIEASFDLPKKSRILKVFKEILPLI